ncbi:hypothetical protein QVD17_13653 [Tagetes erecta]|uniref:RING-type E3 ubiquitin transferase n=1 Tax=Tagetes erecta TaxID=13708 RepID=A0AAD8P3K4_TARER|nr:hypothetical protein QVD17_13653 [Tagetes erecta]
MSANTPINTQWPDNDEQQQQDTSKTYVLSGKIMLTSMITLFIIVIFLIILHLYSRWYLVRINRRHHTRNRPTRTVYYIDNNTGLEASVLKSLPMFVYSSEINKSMPECAVCLSEFENGDKGRILPNCKHGFHVECIDMWFCSHSTCPICRSPVELQPVEMEIVEPEECVGEPGLSEPVTSLVVADEVDRRKRVDVRIDVPNRDELVAENESRLPSPGFRSSGSQLLSLKRMISLSRKSVVVSPASGVGLSCESVASESGVEHV